MAQNITLSMDPELLRAARVLAAERGVSVSRLLAQELERLVRDDQALVQARKQAFANLNRGFRFGNAKFDRDSLYER